MARPVSAAYRAAPRMSLWIDRDRRSISGGEGMPNLRNGWAVCANVVILFGESCRCLFSVRERAAGGAPAERLVDYAVASERRFLCDSCRGRPADTMSRWRKTELVIYFPRIDPPLAYGIHISERGRQNRI